MIEVNVAMGYSGAYLFHIRNPRTNKAVSVWTPNKVVFDVFGRTPEFYEKIKDSWKAQPAIKSRKVKPIVMEETANGTLAPLIEKLLEEMNIEFDLS